MTKEDTISHYKISIIKKPDWTLSNLMLTHHKTSCRMFYEQMRQKWIFLPRHISSMFTDGINEAYQDNNSTVKHGGDCIMFWACFAPSGTGCLKSLKGSMKSQHYHRILERNVLLSVWCRPWVLQQDNDLKLLKTPRITKRKKLDYTEVAFYETLS